jgi:transposase-like protein
MNSQKVKTFSDEERRAIVQEYLNLGPGRWQHRIMDKYGIAGHCTLKRWLDRYVKNGQIVPKTPKEVHERQMKLERKELKAEPNAPRAKSVRPTKTEVEKDKEILKLRLELERERTKVLALNRMIDIAENALNISIRKKSGAKQ